MLLLPRQTVVRLLVCQFLPWYFLEVPRAIIRGYCAYFTAFMEIFSFPFLLWTLFSPWKGLLDAYPKRGLNLDAIFSTLVFNGVSRVIGCMFRVVMMLIGLVVHIVCLAIFTAALAIWLAYPVLLLLGIVFMTHSFFA